ncbi:MAG: OB-fold domain-containing protein [Actinomycetota bacterium]|nr:OB-fold domain-containing protein [Actinomycetota bacterium]
MGEELIANLMEIFTAEDPVPFEHPEGDPWKDFREIMRIEWKMDFTYKHVLGKYSKFFIELLNRRFITTECPGCGKVWGIPRPLCPDCLTITRWKELPGTGTLASYSVSNFVPAFMDVETPYVLALAKMDGADTLFAHQLRNYKSVDDIKVGMPVKVAYTTKPVNHPLLLMWFEPA